MKEGEYTLHCPECKAEISKTDARRTAKYFCAACEKWHPIADVKGDPTGLIKDTDFDFDKAVDKWLGRIIIMKYLGYALLIGSLVLIVVFSLLHLSQFMGSLMTLLFGGLGLIIFTRVAEAVVSHGGSKE